MTIDRAFWVALLLVLFTACVTVGRRGGLDEQQVHALPPEVQGSYEVFAQRCSRCHTLSRPLSARVKDVDHWRRYVARMRRQPGSGISAADAEKILVFLEYYTKDKYGEDAEGDADE